MPRNLEPFIKEETTPGKPMHNDKVHKRTKVLKREAEDDPLIPPDASAPKRRITGVDAIRECLKMTEEEYSELDKMIKKLINSKSNIPINGNSGDRTQNTLDNSLVLYTPPESTAEQKLTTINEEDRLVHVVVDPSLENILKPYQREGVKLMYDYVTGSKIKNNYRCILADEMGMGKTLQCITLVWTLLKQSPLGKPTFNKAIIVCPSSVVNHWEEEFRRWLGNSINPLVIGPKRCYNIRGKLARFIRNEDTPVSTSVLIISYDTFRNNIGILTKNEIGIVICDEGHHLKDCQTKTYKAVLNLKCSRRIIISNTPIESDLMECYSLVNLINSSILGSTREFRENFYEPFSMLKNLSSTDKQRNLGRNKLQKLSKLVRLYIIRRPSDLISGNLPVKYEFVVCCNLTKLQENLYNQMLSTERTCVYSWTSEDTIMGETIFFMTSLKRLCNHPQLIYDHVMRKEYGFEKCQFPSCFEETKLYPKWSGKMQVLDNLLALTKKEKSEDINIYGLIVLIPIKERGEIVNKFNNPKNNYFVFLLFSKAGRYGLNLIGANRLVMFDADRNPANDERVMARIWRNGQTKTCFIYRFFATGTIEERILQRQIEKKALGSCVVDGQTEVGRDFGTVEFKSLSQLKINTSTNSDTHDKLGCKRCINGKEVINPPDDANIKSDLSLWHHITKKDISKIPDDVFRNVLSIPEIPITFTFYQKSHEKKVKEEVS